MNAAPRKLEEVDQEYEAQLARFFAECAHDDVALARQGLQEYARLLECEETYDDKPGHRAG